jgi:hypothetical protein
MQIIGRDGRTRDGDTLEDGERIRVGMTFMDSAQKAIARASTRSRATVTDAFGDSDLYGLRRPGFRLPTQRTTADARQVAYDEANRDAENAWKTPPVTPPPAGAYPTYGTAKPGDACTVNGSPGHLKEVSGGLICVPDGQQDARLDDREAALREVQLRDENAWRNAK